VHDYLSSIGPLALIVMGVSGSGKSTFGVALGGAIGCPFLEGDDFHSPEAIDTLERPQPDEQALTLDATRPTATLCEQTLAWLQSTAHGSEQTRTPARPPK
jgi:gluconate kinase